MRHVDRRHRGGALRGQPQRRRRADKLGFAPAPDNGLGKRGAWLRAWSPAVPASTEQADAAPKFIARATPEDCTTLVAKRKGWANVPPGTRASRYENQTYLDAAPFAETILARVQAADPQNPTVDRAPCAGVRFVAIPEFQGSGAAVEQMFSAALAGSMTGDEALATAQAPSTHEMRKGGCID
jgi:sorbitol/mannitol transport system substrate-binding protein